MASRPAPAQTQSAPGRHLVRCVATAKSGNRCKCTPLRGTNKCALHTPGVPQMMGERGGRRRAIYDPDNLTHFEAPKTLAEVTSALGQLAVETHKGEIDPRVAGTLTSTLNALLSALEVKEQGDMLRELERRAGLQDSLSKLRDEVTGRYVKDDAEEKIQ